MSSYQACFFTEMCLDNHVARSPLLLLHDEALQLLHPPGDLRLLRPEDVQLVGELLLLRLRHRGGWVSRRRGVGVEGGKRNCSCLAFSVCSRNLSRSTSTCNCTFLDSSAWIVARASRAVF